MRQQILSLLWPSDNFPATRVSSGPITNPAQIKYLERPEDAAGTETRRTGFSVKKHGSKMIISVTNYMRTASLTL